MSRIIANNIRHNDATVDNIALDSNGRVGINRTPGTQLDVQGANCNFRITSNDNNTSCNLQTVESAEVRFGPTTNSDLAIYTNGLEEARFLSGGGLTFNGDTAAANALDDYEEGTWTPSVTTGSLSAGTCLYTKVGRLVTCSGTVSNFSNQTSSNVIYLGSLPFTPGADQVVGSCAIRYYNGPDTVPQVQTNGNLFFTKLSNTGNFDQATHSDFNSSNGMIYFILTYAAA